MSDSVHRVTEPGMPVIYVTGHRNPDADSIGSAIGYAELKRRLDPHNDYVAARLGEVNAQTRWLLDRSGAAEPGVSAACEAPRLGRDARRVPGRPLTTSRCARWGRRWPAAGSISCRSSTTPACSSA